MTSRPNQSTQSTQSNQSRDSARLDATLKSAVAVGLLPDTARVAAQEERPWPVVLLTALGAWLAALPLVGVVGLLFGSVLGKQMGPYLIGVATLVGAVVVLRSHGVRLFVEQLAVVGLLVGMAVLGMGLFNDLGTPLGAAVSLMVVLGLAFALHQPWLRVLLGAAAALLLSLALNITGGGGAASSYFTPFRLWLDWHIALALWALAVWVQHTGLTFDGRARAAAALESLGTGWLLALLYGLAVWAGMSFLVGASLGGGLVGGVAAELVGGSPNPWQSTLPQFVSATLALVAAWWAARQWLLLKQAWLAGVAAVMVALAWFMPSLGAVLVILAFCATSGRARVASVAALAAVWIVGAFYYQLAWQLSTKAVVLVAAGAVLGGLAWIAWRAAGQQPEVGKADNAVEKIKPAQVTRQWAGAGIALTALAVLSVANVGIWQKENLIAHGQALFVVLAPADPRSLMQGDFMRLNFSMPGDVGAMSDEIVSAARPRVVARRDERGVATVLRLHAGAPLAADELLIELAPKDGRWILVSDAWFFKEGEASRWEKAKYGEFRVEPSGRALLVGLRGAKLEAL